MQALWDAEFHDRHTALAVLTLVGCGDTFVRETVKGFFAGQAGKLRRSLASTRSIDVTLLLAMVLLLERSSSSPDEGLLWLGELDAIRGLLKPQHRIEIYGWLHRVVRDSAGKSHSTPLHEFVRSGKDPQILRSAFLRTVSLSVVRLQSVVKSLMQFWLRTDCEAYAKFDDVRAQVERRCGALTTQLNQLVDDSIQVEDRRKLLHDAKSTAEHLLSDACRLHDGVFTPIGLAAMRSEGANHGPALLGRLASLNSGGMDQSVRWVTPSPYDVATQVAALHKPELVEAWVVWDAALVEAMKDILTNVKHADQKTSNPWNEDDSDEARIWGRVVVEQNLVAIELCNSARDALASAEILNKRSSQSRSFIAEAGCEFTCYARDDPRLIVVRVELPYAHTLRPSGKGKGHV
jgi:hypothetical protein